MSKVLIFIPSPRDLGPVLESVAKLKSDKLWMKYYPEEYAYQYARDWFLEHTEYSHLMIHPDDLLVTQKDFERLQKDADQNYEIISGYCRNTIRQRHDWNGEKETEETADTNVSFTLPPNPPNQGKYEEYNFISMANIEAMAGAFAELPGVRPIITVKYAGFPPTLISRRIVEQIPFRRIGCCVDSWFALDLSEKNLSQYCDVRVRTTHLNIHDREIKVGKKQPKVIFECESVKQ